MKRLQLLLLVITLSYSAFAQEHVILLGKPQPLPDEPTVANDYDELFTAPKSAKNFVSRLRISNRSLPSAFPTSCSKKKAGRKIPD